MNQKGEVTTLSALILLVLTSVTLLCALDLMNSFHLIKKKSHLLLCTKEIKGEFHLFMKAMGQSNWAIKNINKVSLIMLIIPGLQAASLNTQRMKKFIQYYQYLKLISFMKRLVILKSNNCPIDPRMFITPFEIEMTRFKRDIHGAVILRKNKWTYHYQLIPYEFSVTIDTKNWEKMKPQLHYSTKEKKVKSSSRLLWRF